MMSGTIAHGLEVGLARTTQQPPSTVKQAAVTSGAGCDARGRGARGSDLDPWIPAPPQSECLLAAAEPGARWVTLGAFEQDGSVSSLSCLEVPEIAVTAVLYVPAEDMDRVVSEVCLRTWL